jgi:WD40 repeat protein
VQQQVAKQIFIELTQLGEDTEDTRRQVQKAALVETLVSPQKSEALVEEVIQTLVAAKLIVISEEKGMAVVDIAHEALIRNWQQLREWVNTERDAIRLQRTIERAAKEWESTGNSEDLAFLWQGTRLVMAENYSGSIPLSKLAQQFLQASTAAQQKQKSALRQGTEARLREQTSKVQKLLSSQPLDGLVLAIQTLGLNLEHLQSEILSSVKDSLHRAMIVAREQNIWLGHEGAVTAVAISSDGKYILSGSDDKTVRLWDSSGYPIGLIFSGHKGGVTSVAIGPNSQYIVSGSRDKTVRLWDFSGRTIGQPFRGHTGIVNSVAVSPDGQYIISGSSDKTVRLWDSKGKPIGEPFRGHTGIVNSVAVSSDGQYIVSGSSDKTVRLWDTRGNPLCQPL